MIAPPRCAVHDIAKGSPCRRCGTLECPWCLAKDPSRWCAACVARRPTPAFLAPGTSAFRRWVGLLWGLTTKTDDTVAHLKECSVWRAHWLMAPVFLLVIACQAVAFAALVHETPIDALLLSLLLFVLVWGCWVPFLSVLAWGLLRLLGSPVPLGRVAAGAVLAFAPLVLAGFVPFVGPALWLAWGVFVRIAHLRGTASVRGAEAVIAVVGPLLLTVLAFFAARLDGRLL